MYISGKLNMVEKLLDNGKSIINNIYHIADVHIRTDRHIEYRSVFKRLYKYLKEDSKSKNGLIVICGDLVHDKTETTQQANMLLQEFLLKLSEILPVIIILGNHDMNVANRQQPDAISLALNIFEKINKDNKIYLLKESGFYRFGNIVFGVSSLYDNKITKLKRDKKKYKRKTTIALYHGPVRPASPSKKYISLTDFKNYDYVLLGDIHKHYFVDEDLKRGCYSGSLICQNFKEENYKNGLVKHNIRKQTSKYIEIHNNYRHSTLKVKNGKLKQYDYNIKKISKYPSLRLKITNTTTDTVQKIEDKLYKKYDVQDKIVRFYRDEHNYDNYDTLKQIIDKEIREKNGNEVADDVMELYKADKDLIMEYERKENKCNKLKLIRVMFSNMFSYGEDNIVDFSEKGIVWGIKAPNGTGKSSLIDVIIYCLYGKCLRGGKKNVVNSQEKVYSVFLELEADDDSKYYIHREGHFISTVVLKTNLKFWKVDKNDKITNLTTSDIKKTEKAIEEYVGSKFDFQTNNTMISNVNNLITDMKPKLRKEFFEQILDTYVIAKLNEKSDEKKKELVPLKKYIKNSLDSSAKELEDIDLESLSEKYDSIKNTKIKFDKNTRTMVNKYMINKFKKEQHEKLVDEYSTIEKAHKAQVLYSTITGMDGIRSRILSSKLELIQDKTNTLLKKYVDNMSVKIENGKKKINIIIKKGKNMYEAITGSGFEKLIIDICIKIAINNITKRVKIDTIFIDEVLEKLDDTNKTNINKLFKLLKKCYDTTVIITHSESIIEKVDKEINVVRNNKKSEVANIKPKKATRLMKEIEDKEMSLYIDL